MSNYPFSIPRARILTLVSKSERTIAELQKLTGIGRTTIYHHLEELKSMKLITEEKKQKEQGQPVYVALNKANPLSETFLNLAEQTINLFNKIKKGITNFKY